MSYKKELTLLGVTSAFAAAWIGAAVLGAFNDKGLDSEAANALRNNGFSPIEVGGHGWHDCGRDGPFSTRFKAVSPGGQVVTGAVCAGFLSGSSIKLD
jgi:hypothetical protein